MRNGDEDNSDHLVVQWIFFGRSEGIGRESSRDYWGLAEQTVSPEHQRQFDDMRSRFGAATSQETKDMPPYLFWKLTGPNAPYCLMEVAGLGSVSGDSRNPTDYTGVLIEPDVLQEIYGDPLYLVDFGWLSLAKNTALRGDRTALQIETPLLVPSQEIFPLPSPEFQKIFTDKGKQSFDVADSLAIKENLRSHLQELHRTKQPPMTFATYWPTRTASNIPLQLFDLFFVPPPPPRIEEALRQLSTRLEVHFLMLSKSAPNEEEVIVKRWIDYAIQIRSGASDLDNTLSLSEEAWQQVVDNLCDRLEFLTYDLKSGRVVSGAWSPISPQLSADIGATVKECDQVLARLKSSRNPVTNRTLAEIDAENLNRAAMHLKEMYQSQTSVLREAASKDQASQLKQHGGNPLSSLTRYLASKLGIASKRRQK